MRASILTLSLALTACAGGPAVLQPLGWTPSSLPAETADTDTPSAYPMDIATLLRLAGEKPLAIEIARAQARAAAAEEDAALMAWLPKLQPRIELLRHEGLLQHSGGGFESIDSRNSFGGIALDLRLQPGDAWYSELVAAQRRRASEFGIRAAQHVNVAQAMRFYYQLLQETASERVMDQAIEHAEQLVATEEERHKQGIGLQAQVLRAQAFLAETQGRRAQIEALRRTNEARLRALLLLPEETELIPSDPTIVPIRFEEAKLPMADLLDRALTSRPDLRRFQALAHAAEFEHERVAWSWLIPEIHAGASHGEFGKDLSSDLRHREDYYAGLLWELDFGRIARARAAGARSDEAQLRAELLRQTIRAELQAARASIHSTQQRMAAATREVEAADAALALVEARHEQGRALLVELLDAQRARSAAGISLVRAVCEQNQAQFELRRILGD